MVIYNDLVKTIPGLTRMPYYSFENLSESRKFSSRTK